MLWLYLDKIEIPETGSILHFAPEPSIYNAIKRKFPHTHYITADIDPSGYDFADNIIQFDLCDMDAYPSEQYDLIIHSHVLEHTPCNIAYTLYHIHRILKPNGFHVCIIPFMSGKYDESFQDISAEEKIRRFGQADHVRRFGNEDIGSHLGKLIKIAPNYDATATFSEQVLSEANIPRASWTDYTINSVLSLRKFDMLLLVR